MKRKFKLANVLRLTVLSFVILLTGMISQVPQEGMYPLSEIHKLDLQDAGLKIDASEIYNPEGVSLIDALVHIGGCTGSFVSNTGLMITNHHCAFGAINRASTPDNNILENGFLATDYSEEIPAKGYTVRITESYEDVSAAILSATEGINDLSERAKIISDKIKEIQDEATDEENSIVAKVSEMFVGQSYILFKYRTIRDVRLVFAPPRSIGEFGGETDNWIWPRHTGDFSFMRAYVAPDGSAADYSEDNVPFTPKKFLKVNPSGVKENDFVFILGYPGRTYRHKPSQFLQFQEQYQLPYISELFEWMIKQYEELGRGSVELQLKYATPIKRLANTMKNYKGKLRGLKRINLVEKKQNEEKMLSEFINGSDELTKKYGKLFENTETEYQKSFKLARAYFWHIFLTRFSATFAAGNFVNDFIAELEKPEEERKLDAFQNRYNRIKSTLANYSPKLEREFMIKMFTDQFEFNEDSQIKSVGKRVENNAESIGKLVDELMESNILNKTFLDSLFSSQSADGLPFNTNMLEFIKSVKKESDEINDSEKDANNNLDKLSAELYEVKRLWKKTSFIPDANSTLRLTYGNIKGYAPADAIYYAPFTTLDGVIDKSLMGGEYVIPEKLKELYDSKDYGQFYDEDLKGLPVCLLYNMDTTGGNSGSPIMNAYGELIGVNFDRAYEATINDYAWNESYSRSIGVDIRYVLWIMQKVGGADNLLTEMGVKL